MSRPAQTSRPRSRWRRAIGGVAVFALFAGMLFWTKLRMVSDIPRSAYAVPPEDGTGAGDGAAAPDEDSASPPADDEPGSADGPAD